MLLSTTEPTGRESQVCDRFHETMSDQIAKGEEFEKKAEKKIKGWGLFGSKYEDAAELYEKSANSFKLAKSCTQH